MTISMPTPLPALERQVIAMLSELSAVDSAEIKLTDSLGDDLGMDSVASLELLGMLDDALGIEIDLEETVGIDDVASVMALVHARLHHVG